MMAGEQSQVMRSLGKGRSLLQDSALCRPTALRFHRVSFPVAYATGSSSVALRATARGARSTLDLTNRLEADTRDAGCVSHRKTAPVSFKAGGRHKSLRRGQSLVEFAVVSLVLYMLLAAILTFGHMLYVAQGLQGAADLAAREISRMPLPADGKFEALLDEGRFDFVYDDDFLVFRTNDIPANGSFFADVVPNWPVVNQQLALLMIIDGPYIRYPGALLTDPSTPTGFTVGIPLVVSRAVDGVETIRWVPIVEEIDTELEASDDTPPNPDPFSISSLQRGVVALRINYPFQSASMSSFRQNAAGQFEPTIGQPNAADDDEVTQLNSAPGGVTGTPLESDGIYTGTYGGRFGLGAQGALGSEQLTGRRPVRPFRRVISAQAIYRREVFE